jgi:hypothetical protein
MANDDEMVVDLCTQAPLATPLVTLVPIDVQNQSGTSDNQALSDSDDSEDSDDDVVEMSQEIETFDLCTQIPETKIPSAAGPQSSSRNNNRAIPYTKASKKSRGIRCPICLGIAKNYEPVSTPCGHIYCKNCIMESLRTQPEKKCPMCKEKLPLNNPFHRIYL